MPKLPATPTTTASPAAPDASCAFWMPHAPRPNPRRRLLQAAAAGALFGLRPAGACEYFSPTLRITHPWTSATPASAAFAVLGMRFDDVAVDDQLVDVRTPVAQAVVLVPEGMGAGMVPGPGQHLPNGPSQHGQGLPLDIPAGQHTVLGSTDPRAAVTHLRLLGLTQDLEVGRSYPLTLVFRQGGPVKATLNVDFARFG